MLDVLIKPPSGEGDVVYVVFLRVTPRIVQLIMASGLLLDVVHVKGTLSPTLASVGPETVTREGPTKEEKILNGNEIITIITVLDVF